MTYAIPVHVGLVDETGQIPRRALARVAGALSEQVAADFAPVWHVRATVGVYEPDDATPGLWQIRIKRTLDEPDALGYHTDLNGQPISYVDDVPYWPSVASHELLEMLADPFGMRMHQARLPMGMNGHWRDLGLKHASSRVSYLLEVCDPPEAKSYEVGGVMLSDFLHPHWYRTNPPPNAIFSHSGILRYPREIANGGYVSFCVGHEWYQVFNVRGNLQLSYLGRFDANDHISLRAWTDEHSRRNRPTETRDSGR